YFCRLGMARLSLRLGRLLRPRGGQSALGRPCGRRYLLVRGTRSRFGDQHCTQFPPCTGGEQALYAGPRPSEYRAERLRRAELLSDAEDRGILGRKLTVNRWLAFLPRMDVK